MKGMGSKGMHTMLHGRQILKMKAPHDVREVMQKWCKLPIEQAEQLFQKPLSWYCETDVLQYQELLQDKHSHLHLRLDSERVYQNDLRSLKSKLERDVFKIDSTKIWVAPKTLNGKRIDNFEQEEEEEYSINSKKKKKKKKRKLTFSSDRRFDPSLKRNESNNKPNKRSKKNKHKRKRKRQHGHDDSSSDDPSNNIPSDFEEPTREEMDDAHTEEMMYKTLNYEKKREYRTYS
jgi:hypothetical protein